MNLEDAANALGVHYMTVYRYVRLGQLPAERRGGRWFVTPEDVAALRSGRGVASVEEVNGDRWKDRTVRLLGQMICGDGPGSWGIVEASLATSNPTDVHLKLVAPTLKLLGDRWESGEVTVAEEHRASAVALGMIGRLSPHFARRGRHRPGSVVLAGAEGDGHLIPMMIVADVLRREGWVVINLGANVPEDSLVEVVEGTPDLVAVGVSLGATVFAERTARAIASVKVGRPGIPVLCGGPAVLSLEVARDLGADDWAPDAVGAAATVARLVPSR